MPTYTHAPEVAGIAAALIDRHHTRLADVGIAYVDRHGVWSDDLKQFAEAVKTQLGLNLGDEDEQAEEDEAPGGAS